MADCFVAEADFDCERTNTGGVKKELLFVVVIFSSFFACAFFMPRLERKWNFPCFSAKRLVRKRPSCLKKVF